MNVGTASVAVESLCTIRHQRGPNMYDGDTPFAKAIEASDVDEAIAIAKDDPGVLKLKIPGTYRWERALHSAVRVKSAELAEIVLNHGCDVDVPDGKGYTALFLAPELYAPVEVVKVLVEHGADIHVDNDSPLWSAIWQVSYGFGCMPILRYLVKQGSKPRGLTHAAEAGKLRIVKLLVEFGADVNEVDDSGHTPLDYCTGVARTFMWDHVMKKKSHNHIAVADFLRTYGAKASADL